VLSHLADERIDEALAMLAVDGDPAAPALQVIRATLLLNRGQVAEAEAAARRLLERDDLDPGAHYLIALCREHSGDVSGALEHDRKAGYLDPTFALPALHLGLLARRRGDAREARRSFERALELLAREDPARLLVFGGGLARETLGELCRSELARLGGVG
jgi:chemotaxis protein methyltransferase CheR